MTTGGLKKELVDINVPKAGEVSKVTNPQSEKKKPLEERLSDVEDDNIVRAAIVKGHGIGEGDTATPEPSLQSQIVTNAMNTQNKLIEAMDTKTEKLEVKVEEANKSVATMQFELLQDQMKQLKETQSEAIAAVKEAQAAGAPKDAFGYYSQVSGELEKLVKKVTPLQEGEVKTQAGMSETTQIRLREMELEQTRILSQITVDNTRSQQEFNLKLAEFNDNKEVRRLEYEDKKHFRTQGLEGFSDLVTAIGAGVKQEGGPVGETATPRKKDKGADVEMDAYIESFKCGACGGPVPVKEGAETVVCPNPECHAVFGIKEK